MSQAASATNLAPVTDDAFLADRQRFWGSFSHFVLGCVIALAIMLILMAIFLV